MRFDVNWRTKLFTFAYTLNFRRILRLSIRAWLNLLLGAVGLFSLVNGWWPFIGFLLPVWLLLEGGIRLAVRQKFATFEPTPSSGPGLVPSIDKEDKAPAQYETAEIPIHVVGRLTAGEHEKGLFFTPATLWFPTSRELGVKANLRDDHFLYQFIQPAYVNTVTRGSYRIAAEHFPHALCVDFQTDWSKSTALPLTAYYVQPDLALQPRETIRLFLIFEGEADVQTIWHYLNGGGTQ